MKEDEAVVCVGCGAAFPDVEGPTHAYLESCPGCWAVFGEISAREYQDVLYAKNHHLTVDAYALQHPGVESPRTVQSANIHLVSLYYIFEMGYLPARTAFVKQQAARRKTTFRWLEPPAVRGEITVRDVARAQDPIAHNEVVERWARSVWEAWSMHHRVVEAMVHALARGA